MFKNFTAFFGIRRFITVFTSAHSVDPVLSHLNPAHNVPNSYLGYILMLSSCLCLSQVVFSLEVF